MTTPYLDILGFVGANGYEAEVNHGIGLCKSSRKDPNLLAVCAQLNTYKYRKQRKHRLFKAAYFAEEEWFTSLFHHTSYTTIEELRDIHNNTLYHAVTDIPHHMAKKKRSLEKQRINIFNLLIKTKLDINTLNNVWQLPILLATRNQLFKLVDEFFRYENKLDFNRTYYAPRRFEGTILHYLANFVDAENFVIQIL